MSYSEIIREESLKKKRKEKESTGKKSAPFYILLIFELQRDSLKSSRETLNLRDVRVKRLIGRE